jgi:hypothetical protein
MAVETIRLVTGFECTKEEINAYHEADYLMSGRPADGKHWCTAWVPYSNGSPESVQAFIERRREQHRLMVEDAKANGSLTF